MVGAIGAYPSDVIGPTGSASLELDRDTKGIADGGTKESGADGGGSDGAGGIPFADVAALFFSLGALGVGGFGAGLPARGEDREGLVATMGSGHGGESTPAWDESNDETQRRACRSVLPGAGERL